MKNLKLLSTIACSVLLSPAVSALPTIYFGEDLGLGESTALGSTPNADAAQADFLAALLNPGIETFESSAGAPGAFNFAGAGVTATFSGSGTVEIEPDGSSNGVGRYGVTGDADDDERFLEADGGDNAFSITFSAPVAAFGFYGIDIGDFDGQLTATTAGGLAQEFNIGNSINITGGSVLFWGIIDPGNTFTSVTFGNTGSGSDFFAFDDFTVGSLAQVIVPPDTSVPEPGMLFLFGFGLAGMGMARKLSVKR